MPLPKPPAKIEAAMKALFLLIAWTSAVTGCAREPSDGRERGAVLRTHAPGARGLESHLSEVLTHLRKAPADAPALVATWKIDEPAFAAAVLPSYRSLYADYSREFDRAAPSLGLKRGTTRFDKTPVESCVVSDDETGSFHHRFHLLPVDGVTPYIVIRNAGQLADIAGYRPAWVVKLLITVAD